MTLLSWLRVFTYLTAGQGMHDLFRTKHFCLTDLISRISIALHVALLLCKCYCSSLGSSMCWGRLLFHLYLFCPLAATAELTDALAILQSSAVMVGDRGSGTRNGMSAIVFTTPRIWTVIISGASHIVATRCFMISRLRS